jgi:radical SAM superfamily enzyme YgiQ (UPF0313 family)
MTQCIILAGGVDSPNTAPAIQRSLGPYRVASSLENAGYTTFVLDYIIHFSVEEIKLVLKHHIGPDTLWVGFSSTFFYKAYNSQLKSTKHVMYYADIDEVEEVINFIKDLSSAKIIYGGAGAPFRMDHDLVDYYVLGYADNSIIELTKSIESNIELPSHDIVDVSGVKRTVIDSAKFPEPKMDQLDTRFQNVLPGEGLPIELARGCIFRCKFCSYPLLGKKKGTYLRDPNLVRDELIELWEKHGTENYYFTDDTFNDDNDKIEALHKIFTSLPFKPKFSCYLRIDLIHKYPHQADLLAEMGLIGNYFGLETMQPKSAIAIGKGLAPNKVKDRLYWLDEKWHNKVNMAAGFILGLPYDTKEYFKELIAWCREKDNPIDFIDFYSLHLYKRTGEGKTKLANYSSEFSLNYDIYGYEFPSDNYRSWKLPENNLTFEECGQIAEYYKGFMQRRNKFAEFQMITALNSGVSLEDLYSLTIKEIMDKYPIPQMNLDRIDQYKNLVGVNKR